MKKIIKISAITCYILTIVGVVSWCIDGVFILEFMPIGVALFHSFKEIADWVKL